MAATIPARRHWRSAGAIVLAVALTTLFTASREARAIEPAEMQPHRQTVADIKAVGSAIISWMTDQVSRRPTGEILGTGGGTVDVADYPPITVADLEARLVPAYIADVPELDGWGNPYDYRLDPVLTAPSGIALIRSAGADGVYEGDIYTTAATSKRWRKTWYGPTARTYGAPGPR